MKQLAYYLAKDKYRLGLAVMLALLSNAFALIGPGLSGKAIDAITPGKGAVNFPVVYRYVSYMILFYALSAFLSYLLSILMLKIAQEFAGRMRKEVFNRLLSLPVSYFDRNQAGDIISRISYDIDVLSTSISNDFVQVVAGTVTVVGAFVMMFLISKVLVLVMLFLIPVAFFYTKYMSKKVRPLFRKRSAKAGEMNGMVEELVSGQKTIKAYAKEKRMTGRFDQKNEETVEAYYQADYYGSVLGPTVNFINNVSMTFVTVAGAVMYLLSRLTLGDVSAFVLYSRKFAGPINEMANIFSEIQSALSAAERVFRVINEPEEAKDVYQAFELKDARGEVVMKQVSFAYQQDQMILKDWSMETHAGEVVAIVGPTGAGKTTLINLLMRFYDPVSGEIFIDGHENREITRNSLRSSYTMVLQDTWLFEGTVHENIAYSSDKPVSREQVIQVAKAAGIHEFVSKLPKGYDTVITEDGVNLSKGQKQLLTIARAMLKEAQMLILDEATSNVDTRTELSIREAMGKLMKGKTCFIIAHRLSTIKNADRILVVNQGEIMESGTHAELMKHQGIYYKLYTSQFS